MLVAIQKQAEKKLIVVVVVPRLPPALSHPPGPSAPFCLWPGGCHPGTCQQKLSEFDQLQTFAGMATNVVKNVPSSPMSSVFVSRWDFQAKHWKSYCIHVFSSASPPGSLHNCVWQKRAPGIHEEALRSHERAPSGRNINTAAAFFNFCVKTLVTGSASRRCAALAAPHYGHQGARVPFHRPLGLADQGTKMGV